MFQCLTVSFPAFLLCTETEIATVGRKLDEIEEEIKQLKKNPVEEGTKGYAAWREDLTRACKKEEQLRDEKKQLRDKEILLLNKQASQGVLNTTHIHPTPPPIQFPNFLPIHLTTSAPSSSSA